MRTSPRLAFLITALAAGCSGSGSSSAGNSLGAADGGDEDAGADDAGADDAGADDAGADDAGAEDAGAEDAGADDAGALDAGVGDAGDLDAGDLDAGDAATCDLGAAQSAATADNLSVFGEVTYFADGIGLAAGRYRVTYLDGCIKYGGGQGWTVHAYPPPQASSYGWWLVDSERVQLALAPGTTGYDVSNGAFETFEECVTANLKVAPIELEFPGGRLGLALFDSPYSDNLAGLDGRNPSYRLERLGACPN